MRAGRGGAGRLRFGPRLGRSRFVGLGVVVRLGPRRLRLGLLHHAVGPLEMLLGGPQRDPREPPGDREHELVDLGLVEQREHLLERSALVFRAMRVGADRDADPLLAGFAHQAQVGGLVALALFFRVVAIEEARVDLDGHAARRGRVEHLILVALEGRFLGPVAEDRRDVEVADDVPGQPFDRVEQGRHVEFPRALDADVIEERDELRIVERPVVVRALGRMFDRDEVDRADQAVGTHRVDDVLRVGAAARVVVDLGADRVAHAAAQPLGDHRRVPDLDPGRLGRAVEVAGRGQLQRAAHQIDRRRVLEGQVVHVVADHEETRAAAPAGVEEP